MSWHGELLAFGAMVLLAGVGLYQCSLAESPRSLPLPGAALLFVGLALLAAVQALTGLINYAGDALVLILYMVLCAMGLMLGFAAGRDLLRLMPPSTAGDRHALLTALAMTLLIGSVISALVAYVQVLDVWDSANWINRMTQLRRPGANLGQPNHLATLLLMGTCSLLFLYESNKLGGRLGTLILLVLAVGLAMTESRTGVLSGVLLAAWWYVGRSRINFKLSPWVVGLAGLGFLVLFWEWPLIAAKIHGLDAGSKALVDTKVGARAIVWPQLLEALAMRPWLGWGLGQVSEAQNAVVHAYSMSAPFTYSHNIVLDLALGLGLPFAVLLVVLVGVWFWHRLRGTRTLMQWYCLAVVLPLAMHSMLEFPFAYAYFLVPVTLLLGLLEAESGALPICHVRVQAMAILLLLFSLLGLWSAVEYLEIEEDFRVARFEALRVGQRPVDYVQPQVHLLTQLGALLQGARIVPQPGMTDSELELARKVAMRFPWAATQNRYALSLALNERPVEAIRQLRGMRALYGEKSYAEIKRNWQNLAQGQYPQLQTLKLP